MDDYNDVIIVVLIILSMSYMLLKKLLTPLSIDVYVINISDVPDSALIIRKHNERSNLFSCLVFNELQAFNPRDQLAFAFVRDLMSPNKVKMNMFDVEVFERVAVEYRHSIVKHQEEQQFDAVRTTNNKKKKKTKRAWSSLSCPNLLNDGDNEDDYSNSWKCWGRCKKYLKELWRESPR